MRRRRFLQTSFAATLVGGLGDLSAGHLLAGQDPEPAEGGTGGNGESDATEPLRLAIIGVGGRGLANAEEVAKAGCQVVAMSDVDTRRAAAAFDRFSDAKRYVDYRQLFDRERNLDGVVISTPDHTHALAAAMALERNLPVYCEKPLARTIHETRALARLAKEAGVATQMGNQGHANLAMRRAVELVQGGILGSVVEVHAWTDRPSWPQGINRPNDTPRSPSHLQWDLWLGPAPERPYHPAYVPFAWRGWWDFGTGALGDMGCHILDLPFWCFDWQSPDRIEAVTNGGTAESPPKSSMIRYHFPSKGDQPEHWLTWTDGGGVGNLPDLSQWGIEKPSANGCLIVGSEGVLYSPDAYASMVRLLPVEKFRGSRFPAVRIPRSPGHHREWIAAVRGGPPAGSEFGYAAALTELVLLGNLAIRLGGVVEWDAVKGRVTNHPDADRFLRPRYRDGWSHPALG